jgi:hypothetical protein
MTPLVYASVLAGAGLAATAAAAGQPPAGAGQDAAENMPGKICSLSGQWLDSMGGTFTITGTTGTYLPPALDYCVKTYTVKISHLHHAGFDVTARYPGSDCVKQFLETETFYGSCKSTIGTMSNQNGTFTDNWALDGKDNARQTPPHSLLSHGME